MKLQTKFFLSAGIAIALMVGIMINYTIHLESYKRLVGGVEISEKVAQEYTKKNNYKLAIQEKIWESLASYSNKEDNIKVVRQKLSNLLARKDRVKYIEGLSNLPKGIIDDLVHMDSEINAYTVAVQAVIDALSKEDFLEEVSDLKKISDKINLDSKILNDNLEEFISSASKKREEWLRRVAKRPVLFGLGLITIISLVTLFLHLSLFKPLSQMIKIMNSIASEDLVEEVPFTKKEDEIGKIAKALEVFRLTGIEKEKLEEQAKQQASKAEEDRHNSMLSFSRQFETSVKGIVDTVALSVKKMDATALELEQLSVRTQEETNLLSSTSAKASTNMQGVSKASSEFNTEVNEITIQVNNSLGYASKVVEQAGQVNSVVVDLETKANAVSGIIDIINGITSQIDLLALNATIEAARAGDMGKGFAVVANEVKALATQTSKATEQINFQISGIQSSTNKAVISIQEIAESVKTINQNSASIVASVEKQNKASLYISDSISEVTTMSNSVTSGVEKVADSSGLAGKASSQMASSAKDLLKQSEILQDEVDKFLSSLKFT